MPISRLNVGTLSRFRTFFKPRDFFIHDGTSLRRVRIGATSQIAAAAAAAILFVWTLVALVQLALGATALGGSVADYAAHETEVMRMQSKVAAMRADVEAMRREATAHAVQMERRQAFLAAVLGGEKDPAKLAALLPAETDAATAAAQPIVAPIETVAGEQAALAAQVRVAAETRYRTTAKLIERLGISAARFHQVPGGQVRGGMGGPFEPVDGKTAKTALTEADPQFKALFLSWKKLDQLEQGVIAIPSQQPVDNLQFTSNFGIRSDPFRGTAAMHAGVDIPGPHGTAVYATADGIVGRAGWAGGYGNLVELEHGKGIQTRYGHLSRILVAPNTRVKRGQLIALMGSTGRSTGCHLHYEVRIDGRAVNPVPFMQQAQHLAALQKHDGGATQIAAIGGPAD